MDDAKKDMICTDFQPTRDELIQKIIQAISRIDTPYYLIHAAAAILD